METIARLTSTKPAQPMPAGHYECWPTSTGLSIVHMGKRGPSGERAITQVWPPVASAFIAKVGQ